MRSHASPHCSPLTSDPSHRDDGSATESSETSPNATTHRNDATAGQSMWIPASPAASRGHSVGHVPTLYPKEPAMHGTPGLLLTMLSGLHARQQAPRHPGERQDIRAGWPRVRPSATHQPWD